MTNKGIALEQKVQLVLDIYEIQNVMGKFSYQEMADNHEGMVELFANKTLGVKVQLGPGVWEGVGGIRKLYLGRYRRISEASRIGRMNIHTLTTPVIEVAKDGKTAKGLWISPGIVTGGFEGEPKAFWTWAKYAADFVKEDGKWKIWHLVPCILFYTPYDKSWVEAAPPVGQPASGADEFAADRETVPYQTMYSLTGEAQNSAPPLPEQYDTWDNSMSYVK
jgi:hypothetical protein